MSRNDARELIETLRPLFRDPHQADRLWQLWLVETRDGREWIEQMLAVEYNRLVQPLQGKRLLLTPPPTEFKNGDVHLGRVLYNERELHDFCLPDVNLLLQHTAVFGRSGAGKTNLLFKLLSELRGQSVPYWIFDWKRDYRPLIRDAPETRIFTLARAPSPLLFNPLIPPRGCEADIERYIAKIVDVIGQSFYVGHGVKALLSRAFHALVRAWREDPRANPLTFRAVLKWIREYQPPKGEGRRTADWKESTVRALEQLCVGDFGDSLNLPRGLELDSLLQTNVIFELDALASDQRQFFTEMLLLWLRTRLLADLDEKERETLRLVLVIEEAHNILKTGSEKNAQESVLEQTLRETRSLGMGLIVIDQTPAYINKVATSNTFLSLYLSLQGRANIQAASDALLLEDEQKQMLGRLPVGTAVCKLQDRWVDPFLIRVPLMKTKRNVVSDHDLRGHMHDYQERLQALAGYSGFSRPEIPESELVPLILEAGKQGISDDEKAFLLDIAKEPFVGMARRYRKIGVSTRNGNRLRQRLEDEGYVVIREIKTQSGQLKLPELTAKAAELLQGLGQPVKRQGSAGGLEHRYWIHRIAEAYETRGYTVSIEKAVDGMQRVDIEAVKDGDRVAIEVETGQSDIAANVRKLQAAAFTRIIMAATRPFVLKRCEAAVAGIPHAEAVLARTLV